MNFYLYLVTSFGAVTRDERLRRRLLETSVLPVEVLFSASCCTSITRYPELFFSVAQSKNKGRDIKELQQ